MSDATYIELPAQKKPRFPWLRGWRGLLLLLIIAGVAAAVWLSLWFAEGKLTSTYARVDTTVYTVEASFPTTIEQLLVQPGQEVEAGQPLARIDARAFAESLKASGEYQTNSQTQESEDNAASIGVMEEEEKKMAARLAQAQIQEDRYRQAHHQLVTEHVRAQLAMRSQDINNRTTWEQARQIEAAARSRMEWAKEEYEKVSHARWAIDKELAKIRAEVLRRKRIGYRPPTPSAPKTDPRLEQAIAHASALYSPARGKIVGINAQAGTPMASGETVFAIMPTGNQAPDKWIQAWFPTIMRKNLAPGQKAQIRINDKVITGTVSVIAPGEQSLPVENAQTPYVPVQIQVPDQQELANLAPGTKVDCQIQTHYMPGENFVAEITNLIYQFF